MKIYKATIKRTHHEAEYTVRAKDEKEAERKIFAICGEHLKITEV